MITARRPAVLRVAVAVVAAAVAVAAAGQSGPPASDDPLFMDTLPADIQSADNAVLATWLRQLGLDDRGEPEDLRKRLLERYGLPLSEEQSSIDPDGAIIVRSARSARYRTDKLGDTIAELAGEVSVAARERNSGTLHLIRADRIAYHEGRHSLTAAGSVVYTVVTDSGSEVFRGESLSVDTQRWEGIFYAGASRRDQPVEEELTFAYAGRASTRRKDGTVVMEEATITSSEDADDPNYRIEAQRLWILAPDEWAVRDAFLYIGEVPVLYLPYFIRPAGRLLFHPALGQRRREGTFLQTTTYLIGRKSPAESSLSFLQEGDVPAYEEERSGLFLRPVRAADPDATGEDGDLLALIVDLYARLGVFGGLQGKIGDISLFAGIGASRSLVEDERVGGSYTPYLQGADGELVSHWDTSTILGATVPLRYGLELKVERRSVLGGLQGSFALFSDPSFSTDFLARTDDLATGGLLGWPQGPLVPPPARNRLEWRLGGDIALHPFINSPVLSTLRIPTLAARWLWRSGREEHAGSAPIDRLKAASPTREFYYPEILTLPAVAAVAAGSLYQWPDGEGGFRANVGYSLRSVMAVDHLFDNDYPATREQVSLDTRYSRVDSRVTGQITYSASTFDGLLGVDGSITESAAYQVHLGEEENVSVLQASDHSRTRSNLRMNNTLTLWPLLAEPSLAGTNISYGLGLTMHDFRFDSAGDPLVRGPSWDREGVPAHRLDSDLRFAVDDFSARLVVGVDLPPRVLAVNGRFEATAGPFGMTLHGGVVESEGGSDAGQVKPMPVDGRGTLRLGEEASLAQSFRLDERQRLDLLSTQATAYGLTGSLRAERRQSLDPSGNPLPGGESLRATDLALDYRLDTETLSYWKNRVKLQAEMHARLAVDPEAYVRDNSLTFDLRLGLSIHEFLELSFDSSSVNRHLYRYLPGSDSRRGGEPWVNPISDLARSFNFLNPDDRIASAFKLESLRVGALHRLGDWNLSLFYQGRPEQRSKCPDPQREGPCIAWTPAFSVEVRWLPIPELYGSVSVDRWGIDIQDR